jgi:hypothetical protein
MVGKKVTCTLFRVVGRTEWVVSANESNVASARRELQVKVGIRLGNFHDFVEHCRRQERIINGAQ